MSTLLYSLHMAEENNLVYLVDQAGNITPMRYTLYVSLPASDARLVDSHVVLSRRHAETIRRRIRGLPTGFEVEQIWN